MLEKKNKNSRYVSSTQDDSVYSYFMEKILPILIGTAITFFTWLILTLIDVRTVAGQASAQQSSFVNKEAQASLDLRQDNDVKHLDEKLQIVINQNKALLNHFGVKVEEE